jgi:sugar (pentulose or hexulose) kinase
VGADVYDAREDAFDGLERIDTVEPSRDKADAYTEAYKRWRSLLDHELAALEEG